jgi:hypothetical protein
MWRGLFFAAALGCSGEYRDDCLWLRFWGTAPGPIAEHPLECALPCDPAVEQGCEQGAQCISGEPSTQPSRPVYTCEWVWARRTR